VCQLSSPLASVLDTALCENVCQRSSPLASVLYTILCDSVCLEVYSIQPCVKIIKCFSDLVVCLLFYNLYLKHVINIIDLTTLFINTNIKSVLLHGHFHNHGLLQIIENNYTSSERVVS
jgi:hypothetical protein